jgi:hypothetical protein
MKRHLKFSAESKLGIGTQYVELDSDGWAIRQVECYGDRWFNSEQHNHSEIGGIALCDQQFFDSHIKPEYIVSAEEFESIWKLSGSDVSFFEKDGGFHLVQG